MVDRFFKLFYKEWGGLHQAAFLLGSFSLLAQILSLLRDRLLAGTFGAGLELDIYYTAFRIPDLMYVSLASFVSVTVLIPFIIREQRDGGREAAVIFLSGLFTVFCALMIVVSVILYILMPLLLPLLAPGFSASALAELTTLSRILLLSPFLLGISNLLGSVTQTYKKFFAYTLSPVFYNVGIIIGIIAFYPQWGLVGLVFGVVLGAALHLAIQIPSVYQLGLVPRLRFSINWRSIKEVFSISLPRTLTLATYQISLALLVALGSLMAVGSIAIFNLAFNLQSVPLIVVGVSYSVAAFPTLAVLFSKGQQAEFVGKIETAIRHILFWSLPALVLFVVLRAHIVRVVLGAGNFSWSDTRLVAAALALFIVSVAAQGLVQLFVRAYYASNETKLPLLVNAGASIFIMAAAVVLVRVFNQVDLFRYFIESLLRVEDLSGSSILMLPLAFSLGLIVNMSAYWILFQRRFGRFKPYLYQSCFRSGAAAIVAGFIAYRFLAILAPWLNLETYWGIFAHGLLAGLAGVVGGVALLWFLKSVELLEVIRAGSSKLWPQPIRVDQEEL